MVDKLRNILQFKSKVDQRIDTEEFRSQRIEDRIQYLLKEGTTPHAREVLIESSIEYIGDINDVVAKVGTWKLSAEERENLLRVLNTYAEKTANDTVGLSSRVWGRQIAKLRPVLEAK